VLEKVLIPVYIPSGLRGPLRRIRRAFFPSPPSPVTPSINIHGERNVEWSFLSAKMPIGPGEAIEFGCEQGYMSLLAAQNGFRVIANDLQEQAFTWKHPSVEFLQGDFLKLSLPSNHFDLAINCSSVEHVGVAGRYGIEVQEDRGDIEVMNRLADILKPNGLLLMTAPCGKDALMAPWCRVYGPERMPKLFARFHVDVASYWIKNKKNQWVVAQEDEALSFQPQYNASDAHGCAYALGCFVLRKRVNGSPE
jgi:SAM-dependent methyltransferase